MARPAEHLRADEFQFQFGVRHVLVLADQCPAKRQRVGNNLPQGADLHPHPFDVPAGGMGSDHTRDRVAQGQLMHVPTV